MDRYFSALQELAVLVIPFFVMFLWVKRTLWGGKPPPRALFHINSDQFRMELVSRDTGERTELECHPSEIVELRKNQYSQGLWIHVKGQTKQTILDDFEETTIEALSDLLSPLIKQAIDNREK